MKIKLDIRNLTTVQQHFFALFLFALLATILIFSWFRDGHLYGGGDVGLPSYDPKRILDIAKFVWWEAAAPGITVPQGLTSVPLQFFQSILQSFGFPYVVIQALLFWIILWISGYGMFLVAISFFEKRDFYSSILAGLLYIFNPYMMIQVWHRFIHNTFFLMAALPFFFLLFRSWIKTGRYIYLLLFLFTNFIAVYLYGTIAFTITIFTLLLFISTFEMLIPWKNASKLMAKRAVLGIFAWFGINCWWLLPVLKISPAILSSQHSLGDNLSTLIGLSSQTVIPYSFIGINPYYLYTQADFGAIFDSPFFRLLPWFSLVFLVPGFTIALRSKKYFLWALLALVGIFLAKGATSPFGYPYILGFSKFFFLGVLRNPFEKMGIYIPFAYAMLVPLGVKAEICSCQKCKQKQCKKVLLDSS